jgi:hypothetical protein
MGIEISTKTVEEKKIRRCNNITIAAPYGSIPSVRQDYETVTLIDDVVAKSEYTDSDCKLVTDLYDVTYEINGKVITGEEVAKFFFLYNDREV